MHFKKDLVALCLPVGMNSRLIYSTKFFKECEILAWLLFCLRLLVISLKPSLTNILASTLRNKNGTDFQVSISYFHSYKYFFHFKYVLTFRLQTFLELFFYLKKKVQYYAVNTLVAQYKRVWMVTNTTTASKYIPKRTRICINWNPPFQTQIYLVKVPLSVNIVKQDLLHKKQFLKILWSEVWKGRFQLMLILGRLGMYFDTVVVFVTSQTLLFRLALTILCPRIFISSAGSASLYFE